MFGIKIISEKNYRSEQNAFRKLEELYKDASKRNDSLKLDVKNLRDLNTELRSINVKREEENYNLAKENSKLKNLLKKRLAVKFEKNFELCTPERCETCTHEQDDCKKYYLERKTDIICVCPKHELL